MAKLNDRILPFRATIPNGVAEGTVRNKLEEHADGKWAIDGRRVMFSRESDLHAFKAGFPGGETEEREVMTDVLATTHINADEVLAMMEGPEPALHLAASLLIKDDGGDRGRAFARAIFILQGKTRAEADAEVDSLITDIFA